MEPRPVSRLDQASLPVAGPVPERVFRYLVDLEIEKALRLRYCVSLLAIAPDVPRGPGIWGVSRQIAALALRRIRRTDVATTFSDGAVGLLLIDADAPILSDILDRTGHAAVPGRPRFTCGQSLVSVSGGGSCYPVTVPSARALLGQARDLMQQAQAQGGDRLILPGGAAIEDPAPSVSN